MKCLCVAAVMAACGVSLQASELWDMTEVRKHPLDVERVGSPRSVPLAVADGSDWMNTGDAWVAGKTTARAVAASPAAGNERLAVEELFLSSENTPQGPNRIFCAVARPEKATAPVPVVLIFHGGGGHASGALALAAARRHPGMAGVAMDYNGQLMPGPKGKVTQWKNVGRQQKLDLVADLRNGPMYHYVIAARRTIDFLDTQPWAAKDRIGAVGISYGGWVALILAGVDDRVKCVTTAVSAGGAEFTAGRASQQLRREPEEQRTRWLAHYEPLAHAPRTKAAVFFQLAANDLFFWLNGAARNLRALQGEKGWVVRPNSNHGAGGPEIPDKAAPAFMRHALAGGPPLPRVTDLAVSADGLRYSWKAAGPRTITRAVLNWSPGKAVSPGRYWIEFPAQRAGDEWRAEVPAQFSKLAAQAFVNAGDADGIVVSSTLVDRDGLDPMTAPAPQWPGGQLWDVGSEAAAWRTPAGWLPKTVHEFVAPTGIQLAADKGGKEFVLLTNSVVLASGVAPSYQGIRLRVHGHGQAGTLKVTLLRETNSLDERAYTAEVRYEPGASDHLIPWGSFRLTTKNASGQSPPYPFDGLTLSGLREATSPLTVESITLAD